MRKKTDLEAIKDTIVRYTNNSQLKSINDTFNISLESIEWDENVKYDVKCVFNINDTKKAYINIQNKFAMDYEYIDALFDILVYNITQLLYYKKENYNPSDVILEYLKKRKDILKDNTTTIAILTLYDYASKLYYHYLSLDKISDFITEDEENRANEIMDNEMFLFDGDEEFIINLYNKIVDELYKTLIKVEG